MIAAITAAGKGAEVLLLEKNEKTGKKLYITGKGRCNLTNDCDRDTFFRNLISNPKFLFSAYHTFDSRACMAFFENAGLELKTERGNRVFPASDRSSDVIKTLNAMLLNSGVEVRLNAAVTSIRAGLSDRREAFFVSGRDGTGASFTEKADRVIVSTGGITYPVTGSTGDGYRFAAEFGHDIIPPKSALVPFVTKEEDAAEMQGLSLKNVTLTLKSDPKAKKNLYEGFGELLFTHFGMSGPLVLSASSYYQKAGLQREAFAFIDLKPALSREKLNERILRDFEKEKNRQFKNALSDLLPRKLIPVMIKRSRIDPEKKVCEIRKEERLKLTELMKAFPYTVTGTRDENEAVITQGGVDVKTVNPQTMGSKTVPGLYFAGEVLDVDALTGGFNLQIAWSTGYTAGIHAATE